MRATTRARRSEPAAATRPSRCRPRDSSFTITGRSARPAAQLATAAGFAQHLHWTSVRFPTGAARTECIHRAVRCSCFQQEQLLPNDNPMLCMASAKTHTEFVIKCCSGPDMCNQHLHPALVAKTELITEMSKPSAVSVSAVCVVSASAVCCQRCVLSSCQRCVSVDTGVCRHSAVWYPTSAGCRRCLSVVYVSSAVFRPYPQPPRSAPLSSLSELGRAPHPAPQPRPLRSLSSAAPLI